MIPGFFLTYFWPVALNPGSVALRIGQPRTEVEVATIQKRQLKQGYSYRVVWREPDGTLQQRTYRNDEEKAKDLKRFLDANNNSMNIAQQAKLRSLSTAPTVHELVDHHIENLGGEVEPGTVQTYRGMLRIYFTGTGIGETPIDVLTTSQVRTWFDELDRSPKTKKNVHALLSAAIRTELRQDKPRIKANVAEGVRSPKSVKKTRDPVFLEKCEIEALIGSMPDEVYRRMVDLKVYTGMRFGEITALRPSHITERRGRLIISVREAWKRHAGKEVGQPLGAPKTNKGTRNITLSKSAAERFRPWLDSIEGDNLIFTVPSTGTQITSSYFSRIIWAPAVAPLVKAERGKRPVLHARPTPHDLRHTHASMLIDAGNDFMRIQERLGHESITTTIGTYGHLRNDADAEAADSLD